MRDAQPRVTAVVVSYNRAELLEACLEALAAQTRPIDRVLVIDNASTDRSREVARAVPGVEVLELTQNTGGAGGFVVGLAAALERDADWVWIMDDDTIPRPSALAALLEHTGDPQVTALGSRAVWTDGQDHPMNTPRPWRFVRGAVPTGLIPIRSTSFVSMLVRAETVRQRGLPIADYFIWNDDFEFSTRVLRGRRGFAVPASVVEHRTKALASTDVDPGERFYFEVRNKLWLFRRSRGLNPAEKLLFGGSTAVRWVRTFARSRQRRLLLSAFRRGVRDGALSAPRPNYEVLAGTMDGIERLLRTAGEGR